MKISWKLFVKFILLNHQEPTRMDIINYNLIKGCEDPKSRRTSRSRIAKKVVIVAHSVTENPGLSISRRSHELGISQVNLHFYRNIYKYLAATYSTVALKGLRYSFWNNVFKDFNWPLRSCNQTPSDSFFRTMHTGATENIIFKTT